MLFSCPSCGLTLKYEYLRLLVAEVKIFAEKAYDIFGFLLRAYTEGKFGMNFKQFPQIIAYCVPYRVKL